MASLLELIKFTQLVTGNNWSWLYWLIYEAICSKVYIVLPDRRQKLSVRVHTYFEAFVLYNIVCVFSAVDVMFFIFYFYQVWQLFLCRESRVILFNKDISSSASLSNLVSFMSFWETMPAWMKETVAIIYHVLFLFCPQSVIDNSFLLL